MDDDLIITVNMPVIVLNILANLFFIVCLVRPFQGETLKQPLKLLLWTMVCCNLPFQVSVVVLFFSVNGTIESIMTIVGMFLFSLSTSMSTSVWLTCFYFLQIVPLKSTVFLWVKRNHKSIIYCIWVFEKLLVCVTVSSIVMFDVSVINQISDMVLFNITVNSNEILAKLPSHLVNLSNATMIINEVYFIICLCIMSLCSWSTAIYLSRHMRQMASKGLSCSHFRSQVRVTVTGILQELLYVILSVWTLFRYMIYGIEVRPNMYLSLSNMTVINFYMVTMSMNLGVGQAVFRQRAVGLLHRVARCCRTTRARQPQQGRP